MWVHFTFVGLQNFSKKKKPHDDIVWRLPSHRGEAALSRLHRLVSTEIGLLLWPATPRHEQFPICPKGLERKDCAASKLTNECHPCFWRTVQEQRQQILTGVQEEGQKCQGAGMNKTSCKPAAQGSWEPVKTCLVGTFNVGKHCYIVIKILPENE